MQGSETTPASLGFRMPAEWAPHEATWLAWPHETSDWPGKFAAIQWVYGEIVRHLSRVEKVRILVENEDAEQNARRVLRKSHAYMEAVEFFDVRTDRSWTRDFCPMFVTDRDGERGILNWQFNGWAKYSNWERDNAVTGIVAARLNLRTWRPSRNGERVVLEGGSIDVNGAAMLLTTEECLLSPVQARNPALSREQVELMMSDYIGVDRVLWLRNGIAGDDTHGHVDDLARFTDRDTVVMVSEEDKTDANYDPLRENWEILKQYPVRTRKLPMPAPLFFENQRLPASYANFYIANRIVLVPTFNDANDRVALNTLAECFPDRQVVGIHCVELVWGLGALHCMTQQQPAT